MSTNKEGKKPQYKDYVNFLDTYKNGKKDESSCHSLTNSSNNSSTSINSDYLNEQPTKGFKEYLENYENKKFSSVKPTFLKTTSQPENKKIVKTEIFINISNDQKCVENSNKASESLNNINGTINNNVNKVTKMFEKKSDSERITKTAGSKVNEYNSQQNETETDGPELKKISVEEISKKFQANTGNNENTFETKRTTLKKQDSIREKSKIFENSNNEATDKKACTKIQIVKQNNSKENSLILDMQNNQTSSKIMASLPPKPPVLKMEPSQKIIATVAINGAFDPSINLGKNESKLNQDTFRRSVSPQNIPTTVSPPLVCPPPPPPIPNFNQKSGTNNFPIPPPLPINQNNGIITSQTILSSSSKSPSLSNTSSPSPLKTTLPNGTTSIPVPPPPPPPPSNVSVKMNPTLSPAKANIPNGFNNKSNITTGYSTLPRMNSNKPKDGGDGIPVPTLNKNDPRVKKIVYGALREMYGAYHDQANDYLATLPKNRVRKNNGLDTIINSIA